MQLVQRLSIIGVALLGGASVTLAQDYPSKPVRLIIGFPPGGGADIVARQLTPRLGELLGQQLVIDNRPGASGNIALELLAKSAPDGHVLMLTTPTLTVNPALYPKIPYDAQRDFAPVGLVASTVYVLVVHPSLPVKTVKDLISLAKTKPRELLYSSGGNGAAAHLAGELFRSMSGIQMVHVPYKGIAPALVAVLSGEAQVTFGSQPSALPHVRQGKLNALAVTSATRSSFTPQLPSIAEAALPGYDTTAWYGVIAPVRTAPAIINRLNRDILRVLDLPEIKTGLANLSFDILGGTPDQFAALIRDELAKWSKVVKESGMRLD
jgi:tripartite-type tricarboxylate transporter receptor subunit TctC